MRTSEMTLVEMIISAETNIQLKSSKFKRTKRCG